jgi:DNA repair protein RadC
MFKLGIEALSTQEVLALILGRGIKGESVMITAQKLITKYGNTKNIANASIAELSQIKGIGPAKAAQIKAAFELSKRSDITHSRSRKDTIKTPQDVLQAIGNKLKGKKKEHFLVLSLDTRNSLIDTQMVSIGSLDSSIVHPREVFKEAISSCAASVIFYTVFLRTHL